MWKSLAVISRLYEGCPITFHANFTISSCVRLAVCGRGLSSWNETPFVSFPGRLFLIAWRRFCNVWQRLPAIESGSPGYEIHQKYSILIRCCHDLPGWRSLFELFRVWRFRMAPWFRLLLRLGVKVMRPKNHLLPLPQRWWKMVWRRDSKVHSAYEKSHQAPWWLDHTKRSYHKLSNDVSNNVYKLYVIKKSDTLFLSFPSCIYFIYVYLFVYTFTNSFSPHCIHFDLYGVVTGENF